MLTRWESLIAGIIALSLITLAPLPSSAADTAETVKIFTSSSNNNDLDAAVRDIEKKVNLWLSENGDKILVGRCMSISQYYNNVKVAISIHYWRKNN